MVMLILGALLLVVGGVLDSVFRFRMCRIAQRWALRQGGAFDYSRYQKEREEHGWKAWPVCLMWFAWTRGIALLIFGFFAYFGATPTHGKQRRFSHSCGQIDRSASRNRIN